MKNKSYKEVIPDENSAEGSSEEDSMDDGSEENQVEGDSEEDSSEESGSDEGDEEYSESDSESNFEESHKKSLAKLQETDPEFYTFLKENDKNLLEFSSSDEDEKQEESGNEDEVFKPPMQLHVDSEDSDFEEDSKKKSSDKVISLSMVDSWRDNLINNPSVASISAAVEAFSAALCRVTGDDYSEYKVDGSGVFNAIVEMCVIHLHKSICDFLKLSPSMIKHPEKAKKWVKIKSIIERYFTDLLKLLGGVTSDNIISVLLKHLHSCCGMIIYFHKLSKVALKQLTRLWSTGEESARVLSFLCILRLCTIKKTNLLNSALKMLYIAYIRGSKFVSINTLPQINFMKRSLVDLFALDPVLSYQHAFLYVRQLAIHLRNAVTLHKKESYQSVYNWQYIHSLRLWVDLMCETKGNSELQQLVYPLVQVIIGTIKLIPTAQYVPLRFHCIQMLIKLNRDVGVYIPVLPLITDTLTICDISKQHKKVTMKPFDFTFVLRLSKPAMSESGFPDAVVEYAYQLFFEAGAAYATNIAFPDMFVPTVMQLKQIIKTCKSAKYINKFKQIILKIEENSKFIANERSKFNLNLNENDRIKAFESDMKIKGVPLQKYWEQLQKMNDKKKLRDLKAAEAEQKKPKKEYVDLEDMKVPKMDPSKKRKNMDSKPAEFLPSDDSDFEFPDLPSESKEKKKVKTKKLKGKKLSPDKEFINEGNESMEDDVLEDLNIHDF